MAMRYVVSVLVYLCTNAAPALANLYLHSYESDWIQDKALEDIKMAQSFHLSFRLIDDLCSLDNALASSVFLKENEIYPASLKVNETTESKDLVNYIGLKITSVASKFILDIHDKRKTFPFSVIRYPHASSALPRRMADNVYIGQLHRFFNICSRRQFFMKAALTLTEAFEKRGYALKKLVTLFNAFCRKLTFSIPYLALVRSFRRRLFFRGL